MQVQNLPRVPKGFDPELFCDMAGGLLTRGAWCVRRGGAGTGTGLRVVVAAVCLKATDDTKVLWSFDFSQIEARVLAWLAGQQDILAVFAAGEDVYVWAAAQFGSSDRQLGKVLVLALGFGMGATKLRETALEGLRGAADGGAGREVQERLAAAEPQIVRFWYEMEFAAKQAILRPGATCARSAARGWRSSARAQDACRCGCRRGGCSTTTSRGSTRDTGSIVYWGAEVGGRWVEQRTWGGKLAENATQAAARDIMSRGDAAGVAARSGWCRA